MTGHLELWILGLLAAVAGLVMLSNVLRVPYPVFLVLGGLTLGLIPAVPDVELPPDLVLLVFLPPILYSAAFFSSPRDLRANLRPIGFLSIGLVLVTIVTVAVVAHAVTGLPWGAAFVLGTVLAPTDPVAATAIAARLGMPRRVVTILEGESLINDGTALVLYRVAVAAVVTGTFSLLDAGLEFALYGTGGAVIGLVVAWAISRVRRWTEDSLVEITISLFTPYAAYVPAEEIGASGVLAAVAAGLYLGWYSPEMTAPRNRLQASTVWEVLPFLLNSLLFILIGLQLPNILERLSGEYAASEVLLYAALVSLVVLGPVLARTRSLSSLAASRRGRLHGYEGGSLSGGRPRHPPYGRGRGLVPRARPDPLSHLLRHPGHPGAAELQPPVRHPPLRPGGRRRRRRARGGRGARAGGGGGAREDRAAGG